MQYQDFILEEFRARRARNPNYSLRAFARDLGMPASKLSQNLRGLCGISVAKAQVIADKIQMREDKRQLFLALVEAQHARSRVARQQAQSRLNDLRMECFTELDVNRFAVVRDWFCMAILEMIELSDFRPDVAWISKRLGIPADVVREAVGRLQDVGLLEIHDSGWKQTSVDLEVPSGAPSKTVREYHRQILERAAEALEKVPVEEREFSSQTFAVSRGALPELKTLILDFQRRVSRLTAQAPRDEVYCLAIQLFPLLERMQ